MTTKLTDAEWSAIRAQIERCDAALLADVFDAGDDMMRGGDLSFYEGQLSERNTCIAAREEAEAYLAAHEAIRALRQIFRNKHRASRAPAMPLAAE